MKERNFWKVQKNDYISRLKKLSVNWNQILADWLLNQSTTVSSQKDLNSGF